MTKKAQVWTVDFLAGLLMFIVVLGSAVLIFRSYMTEDGRYDEIAKESDHIASILITEGFPSDWNETNVVIPGIAENNRINYTKLGAFDSLTYTKQKLLFLNTGEFAFYFYNGTIMNVTSECFRGYSLAGCTLNIPNDALNIAKTERIVILNSTIVKMVVITWD